MPDILSVGECMVELYAEEPIAQAKVLYKTYGGDTLNMLVAASRLGSSTGYMTRVGDDPFAPFLISAWQAEDIDTSHVKVVSGQNGLYIIDSGPGGRREFIYYRKGSAASTLNKADLDESYIAEAKILHFSAITQAISPSARETALAAAKLARKHKALVSYDPNLRLRLWSLEEARNALEEVLPYIDIILPSAPEETEKLIGATSPEKAVELLFQRGISTVAVKMGERGCIVGAEGKVFHLPSVSPAGVVDTTGAGDAFDGGFLHGICQGLAPKEAAKIGIVASGFKIGQRGAIAGLPRKETVEEFLRKNRS
ncbi:MAG: sugar kinase [Chloroflexi bacterium]|nr:sugar kinase [Chloroflexota bacterium]